MELTRKAGYRVVEPRPGFPAARMKFAIRLCPLLRPRWLQLRSLRLQEEHPLPRLTPARREHQQGRHSP